MNNRTQTPIMRDASAQQQDDSVQSRITRQMTALTEAIEKIIALRQMTSAARSK